MFLRTLALSSSTFLSYCPVLPSFFHSLSSGNRAYSNRAPAFDRRQIESKTSPNAITFLTSLLLPKSVGYIRIKTADPFVYPTIEPNYCEDPVRSALCASDPSASATAVLLTSRPCASAMPPQYDLAQLVHGLKLNRKLVKAKPLAEKISAEIIDTTIPHPPESDEYLTCVESRRRSEERCILLTTLTWACGGDEWH